ncbi:DUF3150 domain-containing protein [Deltaproteobacteria bacterium Smac51]|nr:DUF3150 domain-containing protein [Deltaproteobacteria bacterium Smac51]
MNTVPCEMKILDRLVAVNLSVAIWTARKKLTAADFGGAELPPEELASWGSKKVCDPERLRIFSTLKSRAVSQLDKIGIRFLGGWAIPEDRAEAINQFLRQIKTEFLNAKESFLNSYDQAVASWVDKHPGWEQLIAASTVSADYVRSRLSFTWQFYKVAAPDASVASSESLTHEVETLGNTLFGEIAKEAQSIWKRVYEGKTEVSHKALSPLKILHGKLSGLSFVEPRAAPVADLIEAAMLSVPRRGLISGAHLVMLQGLVTMLSNPTLLVHHGQKVIDGASPKSLIFSPHLHHLPIENNEGTETKNDQPTSGHPFVDSLGLW